MTDTSPLITIDSVVKNLQYYTDMRGKNYHKLLGLVGRGIREAKLYYNSGLIEKADYNLSNLTNGVLEYPEDALKIIEVYYDEGGTLFPIPPRKDIVYEGTEGVVTDVQEINDNYKRNFAIPGGRSKYYYKNDQKNRRLIFDMTADEAIYLFYISSGIDIESGEDTLIPVTFQSVLEMFVLYKWNVLRGNMNRSIFYWEEYKKEVKKVKYLNLPTLEQIKTAIYSTYSQGVTR